MSEKITLWTRQDQRFLDVIKKEKVFYSKKEYIEEKHDTLSAYYLPLYDWFVEEAEKLLQKKIKHKSVYIPFLKIANFKQYPLD